MAIEQVHGGLVVVGEHPGTDEAGARWWPPRGDSRVTIATTCP
jgi:hypothetical protein